MYAQVCLQIVNESEFPQVYADSCMHRHQRFIGPDTRYKKEYKSQINTNLILVFKNQININLILVFLYLKVWLMPEGSHEQHMSFQIYDLNPSCGELGHYVDNT